ncbi:MAG: hypothetical protein KC422_04890 [Trueperaceae bacterium]|nr:hypothetical protein [Trueperaceae bacterium]
MKWVKFFSLACVLLVMGACGGTKQPVSAPVIKSFTGTSSPDAANASLLNVSLSWEVEGENLSLTIDQGVGDVSGKTTITTSAKAGEKTTFTLTAKNESGEVKASFVVDDLPTNKIVDIKAKATVQGSLDTQDLTLSEFFDGATDFFADAYRLEPLKEGEKVIVNLTGQGATGSEFDSYLYVVQETAQGAELIGEVDDLPGLLESYTIEAVAGATYTIIVTSYEPKDTGKYLLETNGAPIISLFRGNPYIIDAGKPSRLEWQVEGATSLELDQGIGQVTGQSVATGIINVNTDFTLSASNRFGTNTAKTTVLLREGSIDVTIDTTDTAEIIGPDKFAANSTVAVSLKDLATDESVAIIPVYATQDFEPDRMTYQIEVSSVTPTTPKTVLKTQATNPLQERLKQLQNEHISHLKEELELINKVKREGGQSISTQGFSDNCAAPYTVGSKACDFFIEGELRNTTLVFESEHAYWFIDDEYKTELSTAELADQANRFETELLPVIESNFGSFQDFDNNGKIFIVFGFIGAFGYVTSEDFLLNGTGDFESPYSNEGDIFYAAVPSVFAPNPDTGDPGIPKADFLDLWLPSTLVHELKHLVALGGRFALPQDQFIAFEDPWFEEGSAVAAEELSPYPSALSGYAQAAASVGLASPQDVRIVGEVDDTFSWYGWNFLHLWKIAEDRGQTTFWKPWTAGPEAGIENIEKNLGGAFTDFPATMMQWAATLLFDDTKLSILDKYDFQYDKLNLRDGPESETDPVYWTPLAYSPLEATVGATRSVAYYVGKGQGQTVTISLSSADAAPYFMVVRFKGELPY